MLKDLLDKAEPALIELVHDYDGDLVHKWFQVSIELSDNSLVQTMQCTVNWDPEHKALKEVLRSMHWDENFPIRNYNNQTGAWF